MYILEKLKNIQSNLYIIAFLVIVIITGYFYFNSRIVDLEQDKNKYAEEYKEKLIEVRDSVNNKLNKTVDEYEKKIDSIIKSPYRIKYIRYEKPIYINRDVDTAIDILTTYTYEKADK